MEHGSTTVDGRGKRRCGMRVNFYNRRKYVDMAECKGEDADEEGEEAENKNESAGQLISRFPCYTKIPLISKQLYISLLS